MVGVLKEKMVFPRRTKHSILSDAASSGGLKTCGLRHHRKPPCTSLQPDSGHTAQQGHPHPLLPWPCCGTGAPCHLGRLALGLAAPRQLSIWITATVVRPSTCEIQSALPWSTAESVSPATRSQEGHREGISQFLVCTDPTVPHTPRRHFPEKLA